MQILLLKIFLAPVIITICTLVARKYGHTVGGKIIGLPLTSGPVAYILSLQNGKDFVSVFSNGIQLGILTVAVFLITYSHLCRFSRWPVCVILSFLAWFASAYFIQMIKLPIGTTYLFVTLSLLALKFFFPPHREEISSVKVSSWDIPLRILVGVSLIFLLTHLSNYLDAYIVGVISIFPIYGAIFAATTHMRYGQDAAIKLLKGIHMGAFSFAIFFLVLGVSIVPLGNAISFTLAISAAILFQYFIFFFKNRRITIFQTPS